MLDHTAGCQLYLNAMQLAGNNDAVPFDNLLGWQGWQVNLPADWNPTRLSGDARTGAVIVADLERVRLELNWRRVRSRSRVDLARLADRQRTRKSTPLTWTALKPGSGDTGIAEGRRAAADSGEVLVLLRSRASSRMLFIKIAPTPNGDPDPLADRIIHSITDASNEPGVRWCVYGFVCAVPRTFHLTGHTFAAGRARLTFRRRRESLAFERWALVGDQSSGSAGGADESSGINIEHNGHTVRTCTSRPRKLWDRMARGPTHRADWTCDTARRGYRIIAAGSGAARLLESAVRTVICHAPAHRSSTRRLRRLRP